jgi:hypothetical protein
LCESSSELEPMRNKCKEFLIGIDVCSIENRPARSLSELEMCGTRVLLVGSRPDEL